MQAIIRLCIRNLPISQKSDKQHRSTGGSVHLWCKQFTSSTTYELDMLASSQTIKCTSLIFLTRLAVAIDLSKTSYLW